MPTGTENYKERVTYDPNGNIRTYLRNGDAARVGMDNLAYTYTANTNQLDKVVDAATDAAAADYDKYNDIKQGQTNGNYQYDAIGNLVKDSSEGITNIDWNVYGKISSITKYDGTTINYSYDVSGNRINKKVTSGGVTKTIVYVRDTTGNVMSIYVEDPAINSGHITQNEADFYGSSRLGVWNINRDVSALSAIDYSNYSSTFERGNKFFELSNHLGNVLATVDDKRVGVDTNSDGVIDYDTAEVVSANEYYPFGMLMPGRKYSITNTNYRYGFNGKENDNDIENSAQDYGMRIYDGRLGRFLSVDPITKKYPELTPYQFASNTPTQAIDLDGLEAYYVKTILPAGKTLITIITDVKIADYTGTNLTHDQIKAYGEKFKHALESAYKFTDKSSNTTYNLIVRDIKVVNTFDEKKDFGFELVDWGGSGVVGESESIGNSKVNNIKISITGQGNSGMDRTVEHEFGHVLGLRHPKDEKDGRGDPQSTLLITESPDNLMRQSDYSSGRKLLLKQFKIAIKTIEKDKGGYVIDFKNIYKKVATYFKTKFK